MVKKLFNSVDPVILMYFRFFAGILLACELIKSLSLSELREYTQWFSYWSNVGILLHYGVTILAGLSLAFGIRQKLSARVLFLGYSLLYLAERSGSATHLYLYCLTSFWLIWMPVPEKGKMESPAWYYYLLLFNFVVYFATNETPVSWQFGDSTLPWFCLLMASFFLGTSWPRRFTWIDFLYPDTLKTVSRSRWLLPALGIYCGVLLMPPMIELSWVPRQLGAEDGAIYYVVDVRAQATKLVLPKDFSIPGNEQVQRRFSVNRD